MNGAGGSDGDGEATGWSLRDVLGLILALILLAGFYELLRGGI